MISDIELIIELGEGLGEVVYTFINTWKKDKSEGHILFCYCSKAYKWWIKFAHKVRIEVGNPFLFSFNYQVFFILQGKMGSLFIEAWLGEWCFLDEFFCRCTHLCPWEHIDLEPYQCINNFQTLSAFEIV